MGILLMNLLFCGLFRAFFRGAGRGGVRLLALRGGGGIVPAALMAPGAGALWLRRR